MPPLWRHTTVLLDEAVSALLGSPLADADAAPGWVVDGTLGRGGHTRELLQRLPGQIGVIALDRDPEALAAVRADATLQPHLASGRLRLVHSAFSGLPEALRQQGLAPGQLAGLLLDLGVSSPQIDDPTRGFSFRHDGPLDMRMDPTRGESVADFLQRADEHTLIQVIRDYGEERFAPAIAKAIVAGQARGSVPRTTAQLSALVAGAVKSREPGKDPATRTFQALRIHINGELAELERVLDASLSELAPGARLAVISFHSLEDRCVKQFIRRHSQAAVDRRSPAYWAGAADSAPLPLTALGRTLPGADEVAANPRSRSAVLRVAERSGVQQEAA
ncbi:16S rRNA (cytosine(1402)-N(4))-methyltransferase RsmH [Amphibiibacter pelophylacis]|uniref:16S rRNA (Cytosine(1402)-N(4))-methyltransferase RsmH n=1 Tax=Amphibiibacter pelophylacis TaxID=1799477 RepID=A0ACC6P5J7_9BURK